MLRDDFIFNFSHMAFVFFGVRLTFVVVAFVVIVVVVAAVAAVAVAVAVSGVGSAMKLTVFSTMMIVVSASVAISLIFRFGFVVFFDLVFRRWRAVPGGSSFGRFSCIPVYVCKQFM